MKKFALLGALLILSKFLTAGNEYPAIPYNNHEDATNASLKTYLNLTAGYTVTFTIHDGAKVIAGATITCNNEVEVSDTNGIAVFTLVPDSSISILVNAAGYQDYNSDLLITGNQQVNVYMNKLCSLQFTITNGLNPIKGAIIIINSDTATTDINGIGSFGKNYPGHSSYSFTVSAAGYADSIGMANVDSDNLLIGPIALKKAYDIILIVLDSLRSPITGAQVIINGNAIYTDSIGKAVFNKMINGHYSYEILISGYSDYVSKISVADTNAIDTIIMTPGYHFMLTVFNGPNGTTPLESDTIIVNGFEKITDADGLATFGLKPGTYPITIHKTGFADTSFSVDVVNQDFSMTVYLIPSYIVKFNVANILTYDPIMSASVTFNGTTKLTDINGNVAFIGVAPSDSNKIYQVNASGGYFVDTGSVSLPFTSITVGDMNILFQSVYLVRPGIAISLVDSSITYLGSATIRIDGVDHSYDNIVGMSFFNIDTGKHNYTVIPADINKAILSGNFKVGSTGSDNLMIELRNTYKIKFHVIDSISNSIPGAAAIFNMDTVITDTAGLAIFSCRVSNSYTYSVTKSGYDTIPETPLIVDTSDVMEVVYLNFSGYAVTIIISDASGYVPDASVTLTPASKNKGEKVADQLASIKGGGFQKITGADGKAVFIGVLPGNYSYIISKAGYADSAGSLIVTNSDIELNIMIIGTGLKDIYSTNMQPYPNPTTSSVYMNIPMALSHAVVSVTGGNGGRLRQEIHDNAQGTMISVDLQNLPAGVYLIEIAGNNFRKSWSIVKQ